MSLTFPSRIIITLACIVTLLFAIFSSGFRRGLDGDVLGYYMYLPSTFIYHNNKSLEVLPTDRKISPHLIECARLMAGQKTPKGYTLNQYTIGIAILEAPFFFIAHAIEKMAGKEANGYSDTYTNLLLVSALFYALLGLGLVYKILRRYFTEGVALWATLTLFFGTNLFWFTLFQSGMSHVPIFFLYAWLIYLAIRLHEKPSTWRFVIAGLVVGMITLIRPVDIVCVLIPLLYNVYSKETVMQKLNFLGANWRKILLAMLMFSLVLVPQLLYWKEMTGMFVYYSYGNQSFDWKHPQILKGLFEAHNGWLVYTPVMVFAIFGLVLYKKIMPWAWVLWLLVPVYIYIIYSWYCYAYINGFGSRPMIHLYPLLAIPLAAILQQVAKGRVAVKVIVGVLFAFFISANISYSMQQGKWMLLSDESNMTFNRQILFKSKLDYNDLVTYDISETQPDTTQLTSLGTLGCLNYEDSVSDRYVKDTAYGSKYVYQMKEDEFQPKPIAVPYSKAAFKGATWVKCSGKFMYPFPPDYYKHLLVLVIDGYKWCGCKIENKIDALDGSYLPDHLTLNRFNVKKWGYVSFFVKIPDDVKEGTIIQLHVWNGGKREIFIDDICLELYK